jgi:hypothetical protein
MNENPLIQSLKELCAFLEGDGIDYMLVGGLAVGLWGPPRATADVDFLFADDEFKREALRRKETIQLSEFNLNIPTPEDLILLKLLSNRPQDLIDDVS